MAVELVVEMALSSATMRFALRRRFLVGRGRPFFPRGMLDEPIERGPQEPVGEYDGYRHIDDQRSPLAEDIELDLQGRRSVPCLRCRQQGQPATEAAARLTSVSMSYYLP